MRYAPAKKRAFTLIEIMVAIAILSLVIAAIYATWRAILSATKVGQAAAAQVQRTRVALRCLEEALTYTEMYAANANYYSFIAENGTEASLSFVANLPKDFPRSGRFGDFTVRRVLFSIQSGADGDRELVLRQAPILMDYDQDEQEHPLVLMRNVKSMELEFWDMQKKDWTDAWDQTNQMPKLVRFTLKTQSPNQSFGSEGEEFVRIVSPACMAVQPGWQSSAPPGVPPGAPVPPGGAVPPGQMATPGGAPPLQMPMPIR